MLNVLLIICISICLGFIITLGRKRLFKKKNYYAAPNTTRGFALLADFIVFNSLNFVFILSKFFLDLSYRPEFQKFAEHVFHNGGDGLGLWFAKTQLMLILFYIPYSLITELSPLKATLMSRFFGLRVDVEHGHNKFISIFIRNMIKPISIVFFPIFMFFSYFNSERKWVHDLISNCKVLREA